MATMLKSKWSNRLASGNLFTGRKSTNHRQDQATISHGHSKGNKDFLSNIVEEGSMEDLPKTFEQEEQYLDDCLKSMGGSTEDVQCSEVEEYDFDDFNSIASTTSMLNFSADHDERRSITSPPPGRSTRPSPGTSLNGFKANPTWNSLEQKNGLSTFNGNNRLSNYQKSLSRVQNWDRLRQGGEQENWGQVLLQAAEAGDLITVQNAVTHLGATKETLINARDSAGNTPLHKAAQCGKLQCLKWLVKRAPNEAITIGNHNNMTPAAMATQYGQYECLEWLIEETRAKEEIEKENSFNLIHYAAKEGQTECLVFLLSYASQTMDISVLSDSNDVTPAHLSACEGHLECLQTLVDFNCDVTLKDRQGYSPVDYAFKAGQHGCGRYLVVVETCVDLTARLASSRKENEELRNRLQVMESNSHIHMLDRPEAVGGDQSDSSSSISVDSVIYPGGKSKSLDTRRSSGTPDGESPKGTKKEGTAYDFQVNGYFAPTPTTPSKSEPRSIRRTDSMRRRGSFPLTCWEKPHNVETIQQEDNYRKMGSSPTHGKSSTNSITGDKTTPNRLTPPRTPNCSTASMATNQARMRHEDLKPKHGAQEATRISPLSELSSSLNSSRSQSPYRSDRSTTSSTETVLVARPLEQHQSIYRGSAGNESHDRHHPKTFNNRTISNSGSPIASDNNHSNKPKNTVTTYQVRLPKENLSKVRNQSHLRSNGLLPVPSADQRARLSTWHGPDKDTRISSQHFAHVPARGSGRTPEREAQVTWGDQKMQRRVTIGEGMLPGKGMAVERVIVQHSPRKNYEIATEMQGSLNTSFTSSFSDNDERPWYETEEVEL